MGLFENHLHHHSAYKYGGKPEIFQNIFQIIYTAANCPMADKTTRCRRTGTRTIEPSVARNGTEARKEAPRRDYGLWPAWDTHRHCAYEMSPNCFHSQKPSDQRPIHLTLKRIEALLQLFKNQINNYFATNLCRKMIVQFLYQRLVLRHLAKLVESRAFKAGWRGKMVRKGCLEQKSASFASGRQILPILLPGSVTDLY